MKRLRFGAVTAEMMGGILDLAGVGPKPWARLVVYLTDRIHRGNTLGETEAAWLDYWLAHQEFGLLIDHEDVLVVQVSLKQIADDLFNGQKAMAVRALNQLLDRGVLELVRKGHTGHSSLYVVGLLKVTDSQDFVTHEKVTKSADFVTLVEGNNSTPKGNKSAARGHNLADWGNSWTPLTCGNDDTYTSTQNNSYTRQREGSAAVPGRVRCPRCQSFNVKVEFGTQCWCDDCDSPFNITH